MIAKSYEDSISKWIFWGSIVITITVTSFLNYDPVNVPKLLVLSGVAGAIIFYLIKDRFEQLIKESVLLLIFASIFLFAGMVVFVFSSNPKAMAFYGTFGRNTGFLTYIALLILLLGASTLRKRVSFQKIIWALIIGGQLNVVYCLAAIAGFDPIKWNNIYNRILGTFGNPNFIGAFLGIFFAVSLAFFLGNITTKNQKILLATPLPFAFYEIIQSKAIQGLVVSLAGSALVGFFYIRSKFASHLIRYSYSLVVAILSLISLAGALQRGPFAQYIYKTSVSLRGEYWHAGLNMGFQHLFTGVGWDAYGEWYRRARRASALVLPGPDTVTNASHNVFIDLFAFGGLPLFISALALFSLTLISSIKIFRRITSYDSIFVSLFVGWACYVLQAIISINQIGLAIWGWILSGALIAYERTTRPSSNIMGDVNNGNKSNVKAKSKHPASQYMLGLSGFVIGILIALPPFLADAQFRSALFSRDAKKVFDSSTNWPKDSFRIANSVVLFENSKLPDQAYELAKLGVEYNPQYFDAWNILATTTKATPEDKRRALTKMHALDPLNKSIGK